jgi:hypothetical protein
MPTKMMKVRVGLATLCSLLFLVSSKAWAEPYGVNLLAGARNGNAEQGPASPGGGSGLPVPFWTTNGYFTVVPYGSTGQPGLPKSTDPGPPDRGNQFFSGGFGSVSTALQAIDLTPNAAEISTGNVVADLSAFLGGSGNDPGWAFVYVSFYNGNTFLASGQVGPLTVYDRGNQTRLNYQFKSIPVPAAATRLEVGIIIQRNVDPTSTNPNPYNYGCADSLSLILRAPVVVTTTADSGPGSLRDAIPRGSYITFDPNVFSPATAPHSIVLLTALPEINGDTTIVGPGANNLTVQRSTTAGTPDFRIFTVETSQFLNGRAPLEQSVSFSGLTISNGAAILGAGIYCQANCIIVDCTLSGNLSGNSPAAAGGGVFASEGNLTLVGCTVANNSSESGGGIYFHAFDRTSLGCTVLNCTVSGNHSGDGSLYVSSVVGTSLEISNCTFSGEGPAIAAGNLTAHLDNNIFFTTGPSANLVSASSSPAPVIVSDGFNLSNRDDTKYLKANGDRNGANPMLGPLQNNGGPTLTHALLPGSLAIDKGNSTRMTDQRGAPRPVDDPNSTNGSGNASDIGAFEFQGTPPVVLANISGRLPVGTGDNALFAGFIVSGYQPKKVIVRAIGPSLGVAGGLTDPTLELRDGSGALLQSNDNWGDSPNKQAIIDSTIPPTNDLESAIVATLPASPSGTNYTAIVRGAGNATGIGVVEVYDLDRSLDSKLANISNRGFVQTGDNVLFAGDIVLGQAAQKVIIRALGPSVPVPGAMADPALELRDANGGLLEANDNWVDSPNKQAIIDSTIPPSNNLESAIVRTLSPANYTAIVRGANNTTGIAVVEVYALQ